MFFLRLRLGIELLHFLERPRRQHRARPGAEVLRRELAAHHLAQVVVHVGRADVLDLALVVEVLEQLAARQFLAAPDDAREARIAERDVVELARLALEAEPDRRAGDSRVAVAQRRQAERLVVARVLVVADADQRLLEELHHGRHDLRARQAGRRDVGVGPAAQRRQRRGEIEDAVVLRFVADLAPARVIAMLLAAARVAAGGLQVAARIRDRSRRPATPAESRARGCASARPGRERWHLAAPHSGSRCPHAVARCPACDR